MVKIKFDINLIKFISIFGSITRSKVKDCISAEPLIFIVEKGEIAKAIGKGAKNIKKIEQLLKKKIRIIEFNLDIIEFVKNVIAPNKATEIIKEDTKIVISAESSGIKGKIIGRDSKNLQQTKEIVKRYFEIDDIVVK
jgi:transcription termination/antitermination protein NusA